MFPLRQAPPLETPPLRVLAIAEFDPAGVILGHRDALRRHAPGLDFRVALHSAYTERHAAADWVFERAVSHNLLGGGARANPSIGHPCANFGPSGCDLSGLVEFARSADVVQFHPGIGQPWADKLEVFGPAARLDPPWAAYFGLAWDRSGLRGDPSKRYVFPLSTRLPAFVAYFHGSTNAWHHRHAYAKEYGSWSAGLATSTLDYADGLSGALGTRPAIYLPPAIELPLLAAPPRASDDPLIVAHCPTNPGISSTKEFFGLARKLGVVVRYGHQISPQEVMRIKAECNAGFDHLRGSFSVNTLENCALGLAPLCGLKWPYALRLEEEGIAEPPWWGLTEHNALLDLDDLEVALARLAADPSLTCSRQFRARGWVGRFFSNEAVAKRLVNFYGGL